MRPHKKAALKNAYLRQHAELSAILFRRDPVGLNFEENDDEYDPEARTILPRLAACASAADVRRVIHEEFGRWFTEGIADRIAEPQALAEEVWAWWQARERTGNRPGAA